MKYPSKYAQKDCWTIFFDGGSISTSAWKVSVLGFFLLRIFRLNIDFQTEFVKFPYLHHIYTSGLQCPEDVWFTSSWRHPIWDVLKTSDFQRLQDVWFMTSWRRPIYLVLNTSIHDVLKTSDLWCLEDVWFMTCWRRLWNDVCVATS